MSGEKNPITGDWAFPFKLDNWVHMHKGLSKRDWFASQALAGLIMRTSVLLIDPLLERDNNAVAENLADTAYKIADAMMTRREK